VSVILIVYTQRPVAGGADRPLEDISTAVGRAGCARATAPIAATTLAADERITIDQF
jgi:hypothetical protein